MEKVARKDAQFSSSESPSHHYYASQSDVLKKSVGKAAGDITIFLLKLAALETARRTSKARYPLLWRGLLGLQVIRFPPFCWLQKWTFFKELAHGVQLFSWPMVALYIATSFSGSSRRPPKKLDTTNGSDVHLEQNLESISFNSSSDARIDDASHQNVEPEWLRRLLKELQDQGIVLPERIGNEVIQRFYDASNGDFSTLISSMKKTILWRNNFQMLSKQELEAWSHLIFWHGFDLELHPCLFVRLGLACVKLSSNERPRFAQAIISHIEHGSLNLEGKDGPYITVILDCEGMPSVKVPMQLMRSCFSTLQDNFPNMLNHLLIIRLPSVARVLMQTFMELLQPDTREKLIIGGNMYRELLSEYLDTLPSYLGGGCTCKRCLDFSTNFVQRPCDLLPIVKIGGMSKGREKGTIINFQDESCLLRNGVVGVLVMILIIALVSRIYDRDRLYS